MKGLTMTTLSPRSGAVRSLLTRYTLIAFVAGAALATGVGVLAQNATSMHHGLMMGAGQSPADFSAQMQHGLKHLYVDIDATDAQKAQIDPLVKQAMSDLQSLHAQMQSSQSQVTQALLQSPVDRAALEAARAAHLQLADQVSRRFVQLIADVGDVLTPPQRQAFAAHVAKMHPL
jgi:Spy/CpxP family protein refolding chaperone